MVCNTPINSDHHTVIHRLLALLLLTLSSLLLAAEPVPAPGPVTQPVRGVWVAGPQHNSFWQSREAMRAELQGFKAAGLNSVYAVMAAMRCEGYSVRPGSSITA